MVENIGILATALTFIYSLAYTLLFLRFFFVEGVEFIFKWYDCWVGIYYDRKNKKLYILPIPFAGYVVDLK